MSAHSERQAAAWLYDGQIATRQEVVATVDGDQLLLTNQQPVPLAMLVRPIASRPEFVRKDLPGWRLGFRDAAAPDDLGLVGGQRFGGLIDCVGFWPSVLSGAMLSLLILVGAFYGTSAIVRLIPYAWEQQVGESMTGDLGGQACVSPAGQRALDALAKRLAPADLPIRVRILDDQDVNAITLPGGQILVFRGLLQQANSPDELAGVLGHEIGHVLHRDVLRMSIQRFGLGVLGSGGKSSEYVQILAEMQYSRATERRADAYSLARLRQLNVDTNATAQFFARLAKEEATMTSLLGYVASHPPSLERRQMFAVATAGRKQHALSADQWRAVRSMCDRHKTD